MTKPGQVLHTRDREYISFRRETLLRIMHKDLAKCKTPMVLTHSEETEQGSVFVYEGVDTAASDVYMEYRLHPIPVYCRTKGGAAA